MHEQGPFTFWELLIGVPLFSTLVLDRPFQGRFGIKADQFEHALGVYDAVDQTK